MLVPGSGLGRLVVEIWNAGFTVEGNEISYHQLMASNWVLNYIVPEQKYNLYPFAMDFSNVLRREYQLKMVKIPDVHCDSAAQSEEDSERMGITAADFITLYGHDEQYASFDAVSHHNPGNRKIVFLPILSMICHFSASAGPDRLCYRYS